MSARPSLSARMIAASALLGLLVAAAFAFLVVALSTLNRATRQETHAKDVTAATLELEKLVLDLETGVRGYVLTGQPRFLAPWTRARAELPRRLRAFDRLTSSARPPQRGRARALVGAIDEYMDNFAVPIVAIARENPPAARTGIAINEGKRRIDAIRKQFTRFLAVENARAAASTTSARNRSRHAIGFAVGGLVASALLIVGFGLFLTRSIARPVKGVAEAATRFARGELATRLPEDGPGEVGELERSFNHMADEIGRGRRELQEQNEKLRQSERVKSELVSIVSHELRTPLASILGFTSLLLNREVKAEERERYLQIIDAQGRRLSALLDDFLDVQRLEEGQLTLAEEMLDLANVVREQTQLFDAQSELHPIKLTLPASPLPVRGDPNRLAQVVGNLLSNAIKYSPEGGVVEVVGEQVNGRVRVSIRDEGLGIPPELQQRVFHKFFRGDAPDTGIPGSGLGLTIARSLVEAHGGRMEVESIVGEGSTFSLELPAVDGA